MSITVWLDLIRQRFSPEDGQVLVRSLQQDPLVWQFIQDDQSNLSFFEAAPSDLIAYAPGKMAVWLIERSSGISLTGLGQSDYSLPGQLKARAAQAFETTLNSGLPPADLYTAGLLALTLLERRSRKGSWRGLSEEIFIHRNQDSILKNYHIWRTSFACLFHFCPDFDDLCAEFITSEHSMISKSFLPIFLHTIIVNPMLIKEQLDKILNLVRNLSIDLQLESLSWLKSFRQERTQIQLAKQLIQLKGNRDFFASVFSELERFETVSSEIDPLEKSVPFSLPEDVNSLASFYYLSGNQSKAIESLQRSSDILEFLKAQTLFHSLVCEPGGSAPSRWLEIIQMVPHSKLARLFYARALIADQRFSEAQNQLEELPSSLEKNLLLSQIMGIEQGSLMKLFEDDKIDRKMAGTRLASLSGNNFNGHYILQDDILKAIQEEENPSESLPWIEKYIQSNLSDLNAVTITRDLYEKTNLIEKSIELTTYLERIEPNITQHKHDLARLLSRAQRWDDAFTFLQSLIKSDSQPAIADLELFAEAALRTDHAEMAMSVCQNILKLQEHNSKALVLLGEIYLQKGDPIKAIQHMEGVVELIPYEPESWLTLAWLWAQNDQSDRAMETLKKGIQTIPDQPRLLRALGKAKLEQQALSEALTAYKQAYDLDPDHFDGKIALASVYDQMEQPEKAYPLLESFMETYQNHPAIARLLGHVLVALDQNSSAEPILLFSAEQFPDDLNSVLSAARLVLDRFDSEAEPESINLLGRVQKILTNANQINPDNVEIALHLADIDRLNGQHKKAFETYTLLARQTDQAETTFAWRLKYGIGQAAIATGNQELGLAALQDALSLQPSNLTIRHALAEALFSADLIGKANSMAKSALRMAPQALNNILWYAKFKSKTNEPDEAVRALKEAIQITPHQEELHLWLAKSLLSAGSIDEAHETIAGFISSLSKKPELYQQAGYICIHLNDLDLAVHALEKANQMTQGNNPTILMDLAITYSLQGQHKQALDVLGVDQKTIDQNPHIALLKSDLLSSIGQYDIALKTLKAVEDCVNDKLALESEHAGKNSNSPLVYAHDMTIYGFNFRIAQLLRASGNFTEAQAFFSKCLELNPQDIKIQNASLENAMVGLDYQHAFDLAERFNLPTQNKANEAHDLFDLICSQAEIRLYQENFEQAKALLDDYPINGKMYPRYLTLQSRLAAQSGLLDLAKDHLNNAIVSFNDSSGHQQTQNLTSIFRKMINLHSLAEASLILGNHLEAIQTWARSFQELETQPLLNWRFLYALVTGAETQHIARTLSITAHSPGEVCLSEEHHQLAERLLQGLQTILPQTQIVCLKARIESAFTGNWPLQLNVDSCLQGPEEAAAVLIGSQDKNLVKDILDTYPDDIQVLQAYGLYALHHNLQDAIPFVEKALSLDPTNPINHALLAHLQQEQPEQALNSIETALSLWPNETEWHALAAELHASLGSNEFAQKHIQSALEMQPENAVLWQKSALLKVEKNAFADAKNDLQKSASIYPDNPKTWTLMAEVNRRMGDVSDALDNVRQASQLDPNDKQLVNLEMQILYDQKNYPELENKAKSIIAQNQENETTVIFLAQALAKQAKFEQALSTLNRLLNDDPDNANLALEFVKIKKDQLGIDKVIPELVALAQKNPEHPATLTELTDWLIQSNRIDEAEHVAQTVLRILPDQAEVYIMLGRLQRARGKLDQAITHLSQAITLDPSQVEAYIELGKTYQDRRDLEKAIATFEQATQANNSDPRPYYYAGLALKDIKDYPGAEMMLKQAKKNSPDDANIIRQLGVVTALNLVNNLREAN